MSQPNNQAVIPRQEISPLLRFMGKSKAAQEAREFAAKVASSDLTVLLRGETGVGKDLLAKLIHETGRPDKPFVLVDCGNLPETLSETELFGHTKGAFTGAEGEKIGSVEAAKEGTLFFNEITNMGQKVQANFLQILDKKPFRPVGGRKEIAVSARIIAATNANLEEEVKVRKFRLDLFHRLNVLSFLIPPLRERREDIPELISAFLNGKADRFSPAALAVMMEYDWPGNVRELMNIVQRAAFMTDKGKEIDLEQIRPHLTSLTDKPSFPTLHELERNYLRDVLRTAKGKINVATEIADIDRRSMVYKVRKFNLEGYIE